MWKEKSEWPKECKKYPSFKSRLKRTLQSVETEIEEIEKNSEENKQKIREKMADPRSLEEYTGNLDDLANALRSVLKNFK